MVASLAASLIGLCSIVSGVICQWSASRYRIAPPRDFGPMERGWWIPPWPSTQEFATDAARQREVTGRTLMYVGVCVMLLGSLWSLGPDRLGRTGTRADAFNGAQTSSASRPTLE